MPRLVKGGKWVYGWVVIGPKGEMTIPLVERALGRGRIGEGGQVVLRPEANVRPGDRLLAVRGSRYALGFVAQGPIYEEALKHPELEVF